MRNLLAVLGVLLAGLALAAGRPGSEFATVQLLNGQWRRWTLPDAGQSQLSAASGQTCADLTGSGAQVLLIIPDGPLNVCVQPNTGVDGGLNVWDGGCNTIEADPNFGLPVQPYGTGKTVILDPIANSICAASDAGVVHASLWRMY
jgi:hypothetical protein